MLPRRPVRRKLQRCGDDVVALAPAQSLGHEGQSLGGVLEDGDLARLGADQPRRGLAQAVVLGVPVAPVQRAELALVARQPLHRFVRAHRQRPHRRVIEVDDVAGDGKEVAHAFNLPRFHTAPGVGGGTMHKSVTPFTKRRGAESMYDVLATRNTPALVVYLIDISGSMGETLGSATKLDQVQEAIEIIIKKMVARSTRGELISPRYRIAMIAYTDDPVDVLGGVHTIDEVVQRGKLKLTPNHLTNTHKAFAMARDILNQELPKLADCPAPMVCHLTDGEFTGPDPTPIAQEIMQMSN